MTLHSFTLKNYRSFEQEVTVELKPLTLLFGYNSSGKSSLLRFLPLLADSLQSDRQGPLDLEDSQRGAVFQDLLPAGSPSSLDLMLAIQLSDGLRASWSIRDFYEAGGVRVREFELFKDSDRVASIEWKPLLPSAEARSAGRYESRIPNPGLEFRFRGLLPDSGLVATSATLWSLGFKEAMGKLAGNIQWIRALRSEPPRLISRRSPPAGAMVANGAEAGLFLAEGEFSEELRFEVSAAYKAIVNHELKLNRLGFSRQASSAENFQLQLAPVSRPSLGIPLVDHGEGMGQLLGVLVAGARAKLGIGPRILAIEHPELHLHPACHERIANHLVTLSQQGGTKLLIETHSPSILFAMLLKVLEGEIAPDHLLVYWIDQSSHGRSQAHRVEYDQEGRPQGPWPPEVFAEHSKLARRVVTARVEKSDR